MSTLCCPDADVERLMKHAQDLGRRGRKNDAEIIYTAASEIARMRLQFAWQPIETAPKDGTIIMAWCVHANASALGDDYRGPVLARWIDHNGGGWCWHGLAGQFTHWRPLPDPPAPRQNGSA